MLHKIEAGPERYKLQFPEVVTEKFAFVAEFGLHQVRTEPTYVRYESPRVFLDVYHGRGSYEIGVNTGLLGSDTRYGLGYLVYWAGSWEKEGFGRHTMFQVTTADGVARFVPKVVELVRKYGRDFLAGKPAFYARLEEANRRNAALGEHRRRVEAVREKASAAWPQRDLGRVAELYATIEGDATELEKKRLAYARKHAGKSR
jgi:hypothetical protein